MKERYKNRIELLQGTLDFMILQALRWGPQHGYGISTVIRTNSHDAFQVPTGSLYPALHRLERSGWVTSSWEMAKDKNREFKFYRLTATGKKQLATEESKWNQLVTAVARMMRPAEEN
jgi:PadR family transcriptional regulator, regulatory protein PadR